MSNRFAQTLAGAAALLLCAMTAGAQDYVADFETPDYGLGPLEGQGIWINWSGTNGVSTQVVNTQNHTPGGTQAIEVSNGSDTVADFDALPGGSFDSGQWTLRTHVFVPTGSVGTTFFLVMNLWDVSGTPAYEWNLQLGFEANGGRAQLSTPDGIIQRALVYNTWVEIRAVYDLDGDTVDVYYNNSLMHSYDPRCGVTSGCTGPYSGSFIDAVDLYPDPASNPSPIFFDDLRVEQGGGTSGTAVCFGDGSGASCGCANESNPGTASGCLNSVSQANTGAILDSTGTASLSNDTLVFTCSGVLTQPGLLFQGNNTIGGGSGTSFGDGIRCCGASVVRLQIINPPPQSEPVTVTSTVTVSAEGPAGTITVGDKKCYQYWYRDPGGPCGSTFNLSSAVTVTWQL